MVDKVDRSHVHRALELNGLSVSGMNDVMASIRKLEGLPRGVDLIPVSKLSHFAMNKKLEVSYSGTYWELLDSVESDYQRQERRGADGVIASVAGQIVHYRTWDQIYIRVVE